MRSRHEDYFVNEGKVDKHRHSLLAYRRRLEQQLPSNPNRDVAIVQEIISGDHMLSAMHILNTLPTTTYFQKGITCSEPAGGDHFSTSSGKPASIFSKLRLMFFLLLMVILDL